MEFACRGRPAAEHDGDNSRRNPDPPPPHDAGDTMQVIRDALLLQLQKDRLRQEIIMAELAKLDRAMTLCSAARHGTDTAYVQKPKPLFFTFSEEFMPHHRWPEHYSDADEVHGLKENDVKHGSVQLMSGKPATEDRFSVCSRPCCSNSKAESENESFDEQKLQESNEPKKISPSLKWELTGITIPVKKPKPPQRWSCAICQVETPNTERSIQQHCTGKKHRSNVASLESRNKAVSQKQETTAESHSCAGQKTSSINWSCSTCQANGTSEADLKEHLSGRTHQQNIEAQCQEGGGMSKNAEPQEAKCHKINVPQHSEKPPCSTCQDNCTTESLGSLLVAKIQTLLNAINNMAMNSESHEAKSPPNNVPQDAEQTSQSNCSISQTDSGYQSCCSEPQSENPRRIKKRRKKRGALQVKGQDAEPGDMKPADKVSSDGSCSKSASSEEQQTPFFCKVCNMDLNSESKLADHCNGEEHLEKQKLLNFCQVCNLQCNSTKMLAHHCAGKKHQKNLDASSLDLKPRKPVTGYRLGECSTDAKAGQESKLQESNETKQPRLGSLTWELTEVTLPVKQPKAPERWSCTVCQVEATSDHNLQEHFAGQKHQANVASLKSGNNGRRHQTTVCALQQEESKRDPTIPVRLQLPSACGKLPLMNGSSSSEMARHMMSLYFCKVCNVQCSSEVMFEDHRRGKKHRGTVWKQKVRTFCKVCSLQCNSDEMLANHLAGKKHQKNARLMGLI